MPVVSTRPPAAPVKPPAGVFAVLLARLVPIAETVVPSPETALVEPDRVVPRPFGLLALPNPVTRPLLTVDTALPVPPTATATVDVTGLLTGS